MSSSVMHQIDALDGSWTGASASEICSGADLADLVYGAAAGAPQSGLLAFAYCWRRFGPPWRGSDPHKDLVRYVVGTSHPEVCLSLSLSASALRYGVGYMIAEELHTLLYAPMTAWEQRFEAWWLDRLGCAGANDLRTTRQKNRLRERCREARWTPTVVRDAEAALGLFPRITAGSPLVTAAIMEALQELLRPVYVRDVAITILGRVADDALGTLPAAAPSLYAGYGISKEEMDASLSAEGG